MSNEELIAKINGANKIEDVLNVASFNKEFLEIIAQIHPDKCTIAGASDATAKMNVWKDEYETGKSFTDDVGVYKTNGYWAVFKSDAKNLQWSIENYRIFTQLHSDADKNFRKYIPAICKIMKDGSYRFEFEKRAIPLSGLKLPQEHVNWVLSRLLEYSAYLAQIGMSHCGLNPESVFIVPETHGIQVCSFYHLTRLGNKMKTISGKYSHWYPSEIFSDKIAIEATDIELSKRIAAYLLGDTSGSATKLRGTYNEDFINFLLTSHSNSYECFEKYRKMIDKNFKKQFHLLNI